MDLWILLKSIDISQNTKNRDRAGKQWLSSKMQTRREQTYFAGLERKRSRSAGLMEDLEIYISSRWNWCVPRPISIKCQEEIPQKTGTKAKRRRVELYDSFEEAVVGSYDHLRI